MDRTIVLVFALVACAVGTPFHYYGHEFDRTPLGDAIDKATMKMLKEGFEESADKNVVISPLGVLILLSMYSSGAGEATKEEIFNVLGGSDAKQVFDSYSGLSNQFSAMDPAFLTLANKIYVSDRYQLADAFTDTVRGYNSDVESIDFTANAAAAAKINEWSNEKTKGHIKNPVTPDALSAETAAALFNVIYFQGHWHVPFEARNTIERNFYVDKTTTVQKPTMKLESSLFYRDSKDLGAKLVELPYKESGFRMVVVLPNEMDGLPSVLSKAAEKGVLADVFALSPGRELDLEIPKFDIKSKWDLKSILPKVGVSSIFSEPATGVVKNDSVKISEAFQEAFIKVDEEGATAGAFTGLVAVPTSLNYQVPKPIQFKVDHPFLFMILHEDKLLFAGTYSH